MKKVEKILDSEPGVENYVACVGAGSPRFYLPLDQQLPQTKFAQFGFPVQYRVSGQDFATLREIAHRVARVMEGDGRLTNVQLDWEEPSKVVHLRLDQDKLRLVGLSTQDVARFLNMSVNGFAITQYREGSELIDLVLRGAAPGRSHLALAPDLTVPVAGGKSLPLAQLGRFEYGFEDGVIWRRNRLLTVAVRANLYGSIRPAEVVAHLAGPIAEIEAGLPLGYRLEVGGSVEESGKGGAWVLAGMPIFVISVLTVLML